MNVKMKKSISAFLMAIMIFALVACGNGTLQNSNLETPESTPSSSALEGAGQKSNDPEMGKTLVAYFSHSGNTKSVSTRIQENVGADIFEIKTVSEYPTGYDEVLDAAQEEKNSNARPKLNGTVDKMDDYEVVFIGYPNWWGDMPMAVYTFLDTYDLSGKTVIPFCTHGGSGFSGTIGSIENAEPDATVLEGLALSDSSVGSADSEIIDWLNGLGLFN